MKVSLCFQSAIEYITFLHFPLPYYNYDQWDFVPSIIGLQFRESNISTCMLIQ